MIYEIYILDIIQAMWVIYVSMDNFISYGDIEILFTYCIAPPYTQYIPKVLIHIYVYVLYCLIM